MDSLLSPFGQLRWDSIPPRLQIYKKFIKLYIFKKLRANCNQQKYDDIEKNEYNGKNTKGFIFCPIFIHRIGEHNRKCDNSREPI